MANIYAMTDTWNNSGTTFTAIKMDVTNTASAAASKLLDLQISTSSKFSVDLSGNIAIGGTDCLLYRDAANALALRNTTNAQIFRIYSTYTDASNYERAEFDWQNDPSVFRIMQTSAGTGTSRSIQLGRAGGAHRILLMSDGESRYYAETSADQHYFIAGAVSCANLTTTTLRLTPDTSTPAGGTAGTGLQFGTTNNFGIFFGSGVPTLSAAQGSLYLRSDGSSTSTRLYVNTNGATTWTNVTTAA
jgi:hypothetical protein